MNGFFASFRAFGIAAAAALIMLGCTASADGEGQPQALPQSSLVIDTANGPAAFTVELAQTAREHQVGLMYRKEIAPDAGMLFDFHNNAQRFFWMKNTLIPLDMLFIDTTGHVATIAANAVPMSETVIPSRVPVRAVLEIAGGRAAQLGIAPGNVVHHAIFKN